MKVLRTPDERFENLPGFPYEPHYVEVPSGAQETTLRVHYVDEGPSAAAPIVLLHGEPSWSYLYRKMIPVLSTAGHRVVAPDLVGFGRSDKPARKADYSYQRHVDWMRTMLESLDLRRVTLVCQDWGGLIGLRLAVEQPERFDRIVAANTTLPTGDQTPSTAFRMWRLVARLMPVFAVGMILQAGTVTQLPREVIRAYEAPFPDESYKAGARVFPKLVPTRPDDPASPANRAAWEELKRWHKPFLTAFSDGDPIMRGADRVFQKRVPGAAGQPHTTIRSAGHFLQEDQGERLAAVVVEFVAETSQARGQ